MGDNNNNNNRDIISRYNRMIRVRGSNDRGIIQININKDSLGIV